MHQESAAVKQTACVKITYIYEAWYRISPWECVVVSCPSFHTRYLYFQKCFLLLRKLFKDKGGSILSFQDNHNEEKKTYELACTKLSCLLPRTELITIKKVKFCLLRSK